jgi:hypothetical protein
VSGRSPYRIAGRGKDLARRAAAGTGLEEVIHLERRVDALAESVAENRALEDRLTARVADLERLLVGPLEDRLRRLDDD